MKYKTIILELLTERTEDFEQLRQQRKLLVTVEQYARELKSAHKAWKVLLIQIRPGSAPSQIASEALQMALKELQERLVSALQPDRNKALFLDAAMMFTRSRTPRS